MFKLDRKLIASASVIAVAALFAVGCGGGSAPDATVMTKEVDKSLDKTFKSRNNKGEVFTISDMVINKIDSVDTKHTVNVTFKVTADDRPAGMAMSMSNSQKVMAIGRLKKGQSHVLENVTVSMNSLEKGGYYIHSIK